MSTPGGERSPLREMLAIALPSVLTMTSYTLMQFVDALMVSRITPRDPVYLAAQGNGGMAMWLLASALLGMLFTINAFVAQNLGAGTPERGAKYAWAAIWMSAAFALLVIPYAAMLPLVFEHVMGHEGDLLRLETQYAQIMALGAFVTTASRGLHQFFYGMHRPGIVLVSAVAGNLVNVFVNWLLIYGVWGAPELGVAGAAWGTVAGTCAEFAIPLAAFLGPRLNRELRTRAAWRPDGVIIRDIARVGWPGAAMFANEMVCWGLLMAYLTPKAGRAGFLAGGGAPDLAPVAFDAANAAGWTAMRFMHLSFMPAVGISTAVTAIVGRCVGERRIDVAERRAWLGFSLAIGYMATCALGFIFFRRQLVGVFIPDDTPPEALELAIGMGATIMIAAAIFQVFDAAAITFSAALRGAGDTIFTGVATVICSWVIIFGGGLALIALAPGWGVGAPWVAASAYIIALGVLFLWRFVKGPWRTMNLLGRAPEAAQEPAAPVGSLTKPDRIAEPALEEAQGAR
ncbi:MAG: MATE family efflux transporter [Phycisphaerales bacterium]|nr:MATE family efflux transporter [Phycisphaerales bacterium]